MIVCLNDLIVKFSDVKMHLLCDSVGFALLRSGEAGDVAVVWSQAFVHCEQGYWACCQQDPESVHQVDLDPECNDDGQNCKIVHCEHQAPEGHVGQICMVGV